MRGGDVQPHSAYLILFVKGRGLVSENLEDRYHRLALLAPSSFSESRSSRCQEPPIERRLPHMQSEGAIGEAVQSGVYAIWQWNQYHQYTRSSAV